jgi:hypothetical protein
MLLKIKIKSEEKGINHKENNPENNFLKQFKS